MVTDKEVWETEKKHGAQHYGRLKVAIKTARCCWLYDRRGYRYLDCLAAYSAANIGHHHPDVVHALIEALQYGYASVISNVVYTDTLTSFLEKVSTITPQLAPRFGECGNKVLPKNGGVESVETAIKTMRYYGWKHKGIPDGKQEIIVFDNSFHGRTITAVSASTTAKYKEGFGPLTPGFISVPFGDANKVETAITDNTCGILVEPMQGEGGMNIPPVGFLTDLRELSNIFNLLLFYDEIQVGLGRTGKMFCFQHEDAVPDGIILGKAISGGLIPLSVCVTSSEIMDSVFTKGSDGSTYGGYPLASVAGVAALGVIEEGALAERAAFSGNLLKSRIKAIARKSSIVKEVRGKGLFIGIELDGINAMEICRKLLDLGVVANDSHGHTIRISPPLIISEAEIDYLCERLAEVL